MYHGITAAPADNRYSLELARFREHLAAIRARGAASFEVTFDDGHPGWLAAAEALGEHGWKGVFFVVTCAIGRPGELSKADLRRLAAMGHEVGSHSVDHPDDLWRREASYIRAQWRDSKAFLEEVLGAPVLSASVPGGYYSETVGRMAQEAGVRRLYTSEPVSAPWSVGDCAVFGRYAVFNTTTAERAAALAAGDLLPAALQRAAWTGKKALKTSFPGAYDAARRRLLS
jgi:peptidoglycan/xylan/chitin deacetylase (PgdA/CDA1 family)